MTDILAGQAVTANVPLKNSGGSPGTFQLIGEIRKKNGTPVGSFLAGDAVTIQPGEVKPLVRQFPNWAGGTSGDALYLNSELFDIAWQFTVAETNQVAMATDPDALRHIRITPSAPRKVSSIALDPNFANMLIAWDGASGSSFELQLYSNGLWMTIATTTAMEFLHPSLKPNTSYMFRVKATLGSVVATGASAPLTTASFTAPPAPGQVTGLSVSGITATTATLNWMVPTGAVSEYVISLNGIEIGSGNPPVNLTGLVPGTAYSVRVRACNTTASCGAWSSSVNFSTLTTDPGGPRPPGTPELVSAESNALSIVWTPSPDPVAGYWPQIYSLNEGWVNAGSTTATSARISGLEPAVDYQVRVSAFDAQGRWSASPVRVMKTAPAGGGGQPPDVPVAPYRISSYGTSYEQMDLVIGWYPVAWATSYALEHMGGDGVIYQGPATQFRRYPLAAESPYTVRVHAYNEAGHTVGPQATLHTLSPTSPPPPAPASVSVSPGSDRAVISWNAVAGATSYQVSLNMSEFPYTNYGEQNCGPTSLTWTGLTPAKSYTVRVKACNASGCSSGTSQSFVTQASTPTEPPAPTIYNVRTLGLQGYLAFSMLSGGGDTFTVYCRDLAPGGNTQPRSYSGVAAGSSVHGGFSGLRDDAAHAIWAVACVGTACSTSNTETKTTEPAQ